MSRRILTGRRRINHTENEFSNIYSNWLQVREDALKELGTLTDKLHREQLEYNQVQILCKEIGLLFRTEKDPDSIVTPISSLLSDAASGIVSVVQACDVDEYQKKFQEILDADSEVTKKLYAARSRIVNYQGIEEVRRNYNFSTFDSTVDSISNALTNMDRSNVSARHDHGNDDISKTIGTAGGIAETVNQIKNVMVIGKSIGTFVNANPAAMEACKAATRTVIGVRDTLAANKENSELRRVEMMRRNELMIREDNREIARLQTIVDHDLSQSKLETRIKETIDTLQSEMQEISAFYICLSRHH